MKRIFCQPGNDKLWKPTEPSEGGYNAIERGSPYLKLFSNLGVSEVYVPI